MKNAMIRLLAIATLATSVSAFAATGKSKQDGAANASATTQQNGCPANAGEDKKQKEEKKAQDSDQQKKDFDRVLMGIYG